MSKDLKNRVNGCTLDRAGEIIRIHYEGNMYLDTKTGKLSNPYRKGLIGTLDAYAIKREIQRARNWRLVWEDCSVT